MNLKIYTIRYRISFWIFVNYYTSLDNNNVTFEIIGKFCPIPLLVLYESLFLLEVNSCSDLLGHSNQLLEDLQPV